MRVVALRVLHVEDSDADAALLEYALAEAGFDAEIVRAMSAEEGLQAARSDHFDLHIVDFHLPDGDGLDVIRQARDAGVRSPLILLTGRSDPSIADDALDAGATDFLPKVDMDPQRLRRCVRYALEAYRVAERLREHARALEADSLLVVGPRGDILFATASAEELFGRTLLELRGGDLGFDIDGDDLQVDILRPDGTVRGALVRSAMGVWDGQPARLVWLRAAEGPGPDGSSGRDKAGMVSDLAAGIAHDFNNLLGGVIGHLELALAPDLDDRSAGRHVRDGLRTAERAAELTAQLLAFARRSEGSAETLDLRAWAEALRPALERLFDAGGALELRVPDAPLWVRATDGPLEQSVLNLVGNARDAIDGEGRVVVSVEPTDEGATLSVSDDGPGMAPEVLQSAFDPFFTTKPVGEGTGLGLPLARKLVEGMGGVLDLSTSVDGGTRVTVRFEAAPASEPEVKEAAAEPRRFGDGVQRSGRVLIVDDEATIRSIVYAALTAVGYTVVAKGDALSALAAATEVEPFDVVMTDVAMPQMDGFTLAEQIRRVHPAQRVVLMSGYGIRVAQARGVTDNDDPVLAKPFRIADVVRFLDAFMPPR